MINNRVVKDSIWFTPFASKTCIGIVMVEDTLTKERKAYIGHGTGINQPFDEELIMQHGAKFHLTACDIVKEFIEGAQNV
jgi:hypothetical protein